MESRRPVRFVMTGLVPDPLSGTDGKNVVRAMKSFGINMAASIESFNWNTMAGSPEDIEFSITLKRYVFYGRVKSCRLRTKSRAVKTKDRPDDRKSRLPIRLPKAIPCGALPKSYSAPVPVMRISKTERNQGP